MKYAKFLICALITVFWVYVGSVRVGQLPPLGTFLNPFTGFWQNGHRLDALPENVRLPGLLQPVHVFWDERHVPHIFAENDHDLYMVQGYLTARDRLWQMDFLSRAAGGYLAEVMGPSMLEYDRFRRRTGMVVAAENAVAALQSDSTARTIMEAYAAGVNAWIEALEEARLPLEYKILGYRPEPWTPLKSALVLKYMSWYLTARSNDLAMTRTLAALGPQTVDLLYPFYPPFTDPIIPPGTPWPFDPLRVSPPSHTAPASPNDGMALLEPYFFGSNNWAVSGDRTASGFPILCSDPHLTLNLPSIWHEIQLSTPQSNAYGVTIPGSPAIIIGFNEHIAWGMTNAGSDVLDWYVLQLDDSRPPRYRYGNAWRTTQPRIETIRVRGGETMVDTVYYSHYGPIPYRAGEKPYQPNIPVDAAMRWTAHDPSRELMTFYILNRGRTYDDYLRALDYFDNPAQNIVYADVDGHIAIRHNGKFPLRWRGQGRYLLDGANPEHEWQGWAPRQHLPAVKDPSRGFVSSANQAPADPSYPYYLGSNYASFERGARINEWLREHSALTPQAMMVLQNDILDLRARTLLPACLSLLPPDSLTEFQRAAFDTLRLWNYRHDIDATAPIIFETFWQTLYRRIWEDDMRTADGRLEWPRSDVTLELLLHHPNSPYFDNRATPQQESPSSIVLQAFREAVDELIADLGPIGPGWRWGVARGTDIHHLARIPGPGRTRLRTPGNYTTVSAISRQAGPSWRMIVSLEPGAVRAWGIYPGGQSGNPGSRFYDNMVDDWVEGWAYELVFLRSPDEQHEKIMGKTILRGGGE